MVPKLGICLVTLAVFVATGCFGEQCECEDGRYHAVYKNIDGTCGFTQFYSIPIEYRYSQIEKWKLDEINYNYTQTTEISFQGCSMSLTHQVRNNDTLIFHIQGQLDIDEATRLTGRVFRVEFNEDTTEKCRGNYDIVLTKTAELDVD